MRFDSPPKELKLQEENNKVEMDNLKLLYEMNPDLVKTASTSELKSRLQMLRVVQEMQAQNAECKLFVSNFGKDIGQERMVEALNQALKKLGAVEKDENNPILDAYIDPEGQYAFIEFKSEKAANLGLTLNNITMFGQPLRVGRVSDSMEKDKIGGVKDSNSSFLSLLGIGKEGGGDHLLLNKPFKITLPTNILVLLNAITNDDMVIVEELEDILKDIKEMASKFGTVHSIIAPRPTDSGETVDGQGHVFIEYTSISSARRARREMTKKNFRNKRVEATYHEDKKYRTQSYYVDLGYLT